MEVPQYAVLDPEGDTLLILSKHNLQIKTTEEDPDADAWIVQTTDFDDDKIRFKVSSCHLCLASTKFKELLQYKPRVSDVLQVQDSIELSCFDDDDHPAAFLILLCIIHVKPYFVPTTIGLDLLVYMSKLIDKYELHQAIRFRDGWLEQPSWEATQPELTARVFVAWVFKKTRIFKQATRMLAALGDEWIRAEEFAGIPSSVIDAVKAQRTRALSAGFEALDGMVGERQGTISLCQNSRQCNAHVAKLLVHNMEANDLVKRRFPPFANVSFKALHDFVNGLDIRSACEIFNPYQAHACTVLPRLQADFDAVWPELGLDINDFISA